MFRELVDVKEENLLLIDAEILNILLYDHSSKKNIIWATDNYKEYGNRFNFEDEITIDKITGNYRDVIKPRSKKSAEEKAAEEAESKLRKPSKPKKRQLSNLSKHMNQLQNLLNKPLKKQLVLQSKPQKKPNRKSLILSKR